MAISTVRYQDGLKVVRDRTSTAAGRMWAALDSYREADIPTFVRRVEPVVLAGQRQAAALTNAYLGGRLGTGPVQLDLDAVTGAAIRNGVLPGDVYRRPFVAVWTSLSNGGRFDDAVSAGLARLTSTAETDVVLATRAAGQAVLGGDSRVTGYRRVPDAGACDLCLVASEQRYRTGELMPIHNRCGCTVEPILEGRDPGPGDAPEHPDATPAVHEHGELGPVLGREGDDFTQL